MTRWIFLLIYLGTFFLIGAQDEVDFDDETLPEWSEEDWELLKAGELVPGSSLLGKAARHELFADLENPTAPEPDIPEPEPEIEADFPTRIAAEFLPAYFQKKPGGFIVDPQKLLSMQEVRDRESFLEYHAKDSQIDLIFYIFDAKQDLPDGESAASLVKRFFPGDEKVAVVAYFMGMPEKTQIAYSPSVVRLVSEKSRLDSLRLAVEEALEKSDPTSQLESFSIQLSIRIYWMERELEKAGLREESARLSGTHGAASVAAETAAQAKKSKLDLILKVLWWSLAGVGVLILAWLGRRLAERKRKYIFPQTGEPPFLGSPHAAGRCVILHYRSPNEPPSTQKDEVPDYLGQL